MVRKPVRPERLLDGSSETETYIIGTWGSCSTAAEILVRDEVENSHLCLCINTSESTCGDGGIVSIGFKSTSSVFWT
jgi:hypothetical protein